MQLGEGDELYVSRSDISQMYNRLRCPLWLSSYFGLPRVKAADVGVAHLASSEFIYPALTVVPMRWCLAVRFAQHLHCNLLLRAGIRTHQLLLRESYGPVTPVGTGTQAVAPYIDDLGVFRTDLSVSTLLKRVCSLYEAVGLPVSWKKTFLAAGDRQFNDCLGLEFYKNGLVRPNRNSFLHLLRDTESAVLLRYSTPKAMQRLLGRWIWFLILRRPLLSIIFELFALSTAKRPLSPRLLTTLQLHDLDLLLAVAPV